MIKIIEGNLFDTKADIICHQCNCQGVMGSGVALEVKNVFPIYKMIEDTFNDFNVEIWRLNNE